MEKIQVPLVLVYIVSSFVFGIIVWALFYIVRWAAREIMRVHRKVEQMSEPPDKARLWYLGEHGGQETKVMTTEEYAAYLDALSQAANREALDENRRLGRK